MIRPDESGHDLHPPSVPDWNLTTVMVEDVRPWLLSRGIRTGFFFPAELAAPDYLDSMHPNYSPKLAASVRAWQAVTTDPKYNDNGKTAKTNVENWLTSHAADFGLIKEDGGINKHAIREQIAPIVNWQKGGPPRRLASNLPTLVSP